MSKTRLAFPVVGISLQGLSETHQLVRFTPNNDASLAFSLVLPKNWAVVKDLGPQPVGVGDLTKIGLFTETPLGPSAANLQVFVSRVPFEINLRDWIDYQAEKFGTRIVSAGEYEFALGKVVDAGGLYGPPGTQQVVRLVVHSDSGRIFTVVAGVAEPRYGALQKDIAIAVASFKLLTPSGSESLEPWLKTTVSNPDFSVGHPASWIAKEVQKRLPGKSGLDIVLMKDQQMMAYLRVKAMTEEVAANDSTGSKLRTANEEIAEAGIKLTAEWKKDPDPGVNAISEVTGALIAEGSLNASPVELRFALAHRERLWFAVTSVSVVKTIDRILWMRSKRAYEIALATASPDSP